MARTDPAAAVGAGVSHTIKSDGCHNHCPFVDHNFEDEWCSHPLGPKSRKRYFLPSSGATNWCPRRGLETVVPALRQLAEPKAGKEERLD